MTAQTDTKLPEWPEPNDYSVGKLTLYAEARQERDYQRARADAAMARLRVAVEALQAVKAESRTSDALWFEGVYDKIATAAMEAIGPLPPPQMPTPLPGEGT